MATTPVRRIKADCCVAGGGPAGVMAGLLFARAGCRTVVLEKHADFLRDFRGDTVHPSTLEIMRELGLLDAFLKRPHRSLQKLSAAFDGKTYSLTDFSSLDVASKYIVFMPQWHFLDFLSDVARTVPTFEILMRTEAQSLIEADGRIAGVRAEGPDGSVEIEASLTIGADGRHSMLRDAAGLFVEDVGAPIDVLWFKVPRDPAMPPDEPLLNARNGHMVITIDRGDYYQCAFVIPKGSAERITAGNLSDFQAIVATTAPRLRNAIGALQSFDELKLLTVKIDRLKEWSRPGLVMIGDAAHAMSPVGGVGINLAVQDAVAAANILAGPLADGSLDDGLLAAVQKRREWPTKATQFLQVRAQNNIIEPLLADRKGPGTAPLPVRVIAAIPWLQRRLARLIGLGVRPEHVTSPARVPLHPPTTS